MVSLHKEMVCSNSVCEKIWKWDWQNKFVSYCSLFWDHNSSLLQLHVFSYLHNSALITCLFNKLVLWTFHKNSSTSVKLTAIIIFISHLVFWQVSQHLSCRLTLLPAILSDSWIASCYSIVLFSDTGFLHELVINCMKRRKSSPNWAGPRHWNQLGWKEVIEKYALLWLSSQDAST